MQNIEVKAAKKLQHKQKTYKEAESRERMAYREEAQTNWVRETVEGGREKKGEVEVIDENDADVKGLKGVIALYSLC